MFQAHFRSHNFPSQHQGSKPSNFAILLVFLTGSKMSELISLKIFLLQVLCVEGAEFEPYPTCLSLPAKAGPHTVILLGIPKSVGSLRITG